MIIPKEALVISNSGSGTLSFWAQVNKTDTTSMVLLRHHLKDLKLPTMNADCEKIAQRYATDNADHLTYQIRSRKC